MVHCFGDGNLLRASMDDNRSLGSECKSFLTRSLALLDMEGHGSDEKSICPRRTASKIPWSFSVNEDNQRTLRTQNHWIADNDIMQQKNWNILKSCSNYNIFLFMPFGELPDIVLFRQDRETKSVFKWHNHQKVLDVEKET